MNVRTHFLLFAWLALLPTGCSFFCPPTRNFFLASAECVDKVCVWDRNHTLARTAWTQIEKEVPPGTYSKDCARGFIDGYSDYLKEGGQGDPPTTPPHRYWFSKFQTPEGYQAIQDWYAGFQRGTAAAQASGMRQWITLPVAATLPQNVKFPPVTEPAVPPTMIGNSSDCQPSTPTTTPLTPKGVIPTTIVRGLSSTTPITTTTPQNQQQPADPPLPVIVVVPKSPYPPALGQPAPQEGNTLQLLATLEDSLYPSQREIAAQKLASLDWKTNEVVLKALVQAAKEDPAATVRWTCVHVLGEMKADTVPVISVLQALKADIDVRVRNEAEQSLAALAPNLTQPDSATIPVSGTNPAAMPPVTAVPTSPPSPFSREP
jgi:hypothetical protein